MDIRIRPNEDFLRGVGKWAGDISYLHETTNTACCHKYTSEIHVLVASLKMDEKKQVTGFNNKL